MSQSRLVVQEMETERLDDVRRCQSFLLSHARGTETSSLAVACHVSTIFQIALGELKVDEICPLVIPLHLRYFSTNSPNSCKVPSHGSLDLPPSLLITPSSFQQGDAETGQAREPRSSSVDGSGPSGRGDSPNLELLPGRRPSRRMGYIRRHPPRENRRQSIFRCFWFHHSIQSLVLSQPHQTGTNIVATLVRESQTPCNISSH